MTSFNPRLCCICGIRLTNTNKQATVCSYACRMARDNNITRERAIRLFGEYEHTQNARPERYRKTTGKTGSVTIGNMSITGRVRYD